MATAPRPWSRGDTYRWLRLIHGWLSAACFLALLFFSATGVLLNHPGWLQASRPEPVERTVQLSPAELQGVRAAADPGRELVRIAGSKARLEGAYLSGDRVGAELFVRMQGVRGTSDIRANLTTGEAQLLVEPEHATAVLNGLHRGEHAGPVWRFLIDAFGVLLIVMSLAGYLIFLSLRFRLRTALVITAVSIVGLGAVFVFATP